MKTILLCITGGIAAVKAPELIRALIAKKFNVEVILTDSGSHIISKKEIEKITGNPVYQNLFPKDFDYKTVLEKRTVEHIDLADRADLIVIVPATANTVAKLAHGMADDYLTTTVLAALCPIVVCPSMNVHMWNHPATQANVERIRSLGYHLLGPDSGMLACGYEGEGRLIEMTKLTDTIVSFTSLTKPLAGKKVIVTSGGTIEPIDDVRSITNKSSGKMGVEIAQAAVLAGATVLLLRSTTSVKPKLAISELTFDTAESLETLMKTHIPLFDICIHAAAVSDFEIKNKMTGKTTSDKPLALELEPRKKILESIKSYNPNIFLVAFKAESNVSQKELVTLATKRLAQAKADLIVANDVGRPNQGFQSDTNEVTVIDVHGKTTHLPYAAKSIIAQQIISLI
jgi:phosphopantothenoylcysteine decarboxylase/phosphopantothenate--cysteine ligase